MLELGVKFLISYFIGSLMGAMIIGKLRGGVDIREMGSGNAGGTNALRTQGALFALGVVIIDIGKGVIGAGVVPDLAVPFVAEDPTLSRTWLTICCAADDRLRRACNHDGGDRTAGLPRYLGAAGTAGAVYLQRGHGDVHYLLAPLEYRSYAQGR